MKTMTEVHIEELKRAGLFDSDSDYAGAIGEAVKELLLVFQKQGHSGYSATITARIFHKLIMGEPLSPLTDDPAEWMEHSDGVRQSVRVPHVFRKGDGDPYTIEGKAFSDDGGKTYFTNRDSRVHFKLPGFPPKTEYVMTPQSEPEGGR